MARIDLTPLYRSSVGFDRMANLFDAALRADASNGYPPYNIQVVEENRYQISIAVAGFEESEIEIEVEPSVLSVRGKKAEDDATQYLHKGIAFRSFERKFSLADHVEVLGASLKNGMLNVELLRVLPEKMKTRKIPIGSGIKAVPDVDQTPVENTKAA